MFSRWMFSRGPPGKEPFPRNCASIERISSEHFFLEGWIIVKLGIIGLPGSGKTTVFRALTGGLDLGERRGGGQEAGLGVVKVNDPRLDYLAELYRPKKVTPVQVEYFDVPGTATGEKAGRSVADKFLATVRPLDAFVHCVRFFDSPTLGPPEPFREFTAVEEEFILSDLGIVERRLERVAKDMQRGRKELAEEVDLLEQARTFLDQGRPLRLFPPAFESEKLKGFAFLSCKPQLVLLNAGEGTDRNAAVDVADRIRNSLEGGPMLAFDLLYADAEAEIARLNPEDAAEFLGEMDLDLGAKDRIAATSFELLKLIVFFTCGDPEVRAWPLENGKTALKAAGTVHSDMERGFIRAEIVSFEDLKTAGSVSAAQRAGRVRLEGRDYVIRDGDIILFRFNV
jgi:ribosome-binding ATPase